MEASSWLRLGGQTERIHCSDLPFLALCRAVPADAAMTGDADRLTPAGSFEIPISTG
jgi:hypothetical protein